MLALRLRATVCQTNLHLPKLAKMLEGAEHEMLSYMAFPSAHLLQIHSTNPLERLNAEVKRRTTRV
jgi:putative transposase